MRNLMSMSLACLLVALAVCKTEAKTIHVHPGPGTPIQNGVNAAKPGDTVQVAGGLYSEEVTISTQNVSIVGASNSILDGTAFGGKDIPANLGFNMQAVGCTVQGMTVHSFGVGIVVAQPTCEVKSNTVSGCGIGIQALSAPIDPSLTTTIDLNCANYNDIGISLDGAVSIIVRSNTADDNTDTGIVLNPGTTGCTITQNLVLNNGDGTGLSNDGIFAFITSGNLFTLNIGFGNYNFDAEDVAGANTWRLNLFGTHSGF